MDQRRYDEAIDALTLFSDQFFKIITKDERVAKEIIEATLDITLDIYDYKYQEDIKYLIHRGVIFDVVMTSNIGIIDLEMESGKYHSDPKRLRFYASMLDVSSSKEGEDFDELPDIKVIFIVNGDPLNKDQQVYHIHRYIDERLELYKDGCELIIVNGLKEDDTRLGQIIHDLHQKRSEDMYNPILKEVTAYYKESKEGREIMCEIFESIKKSGIIEGKVEDIRKIMSSLDISMEKAMDILEVSEEEREIYKKLLEN